MVIKDVTGGLGQFKSMMSLHKGLVAVHFWADWAEQCQQMNEMMQVLSGEKEFENILFLRVEAENEADVSMEYEVAAVPTYLFFTRGKVVGRVEGAKVAEVTRMIRDLSARLDLEAKLPPKSDDIMTTADKEVDLPTRLKSLINASEVMLFMKGSPGAPECGFSRQTVGLLDSMNADYGYFDIHRDNIVRQGLKEFSNWPTYPQLYVKGELVGGLDILKELHAAGELETMLPKKKPQGILNKSQA